MLLFSVILTLIIGPFWNGFVASILWGWFVVPLGVPTISYLHAVGLGLVVGIYKNAPAAQQQGKKSEIDAMGEMLGHAFVTPALMLVIGWFIKLLMS
jgi:hypothetical protein